MDDGSGVDEVRVTQRIAGVFKDDGIVIHYELGDTAKVIVHFIKPASVVSFLQLVVDFVNTEGHFEKILEETEHHVGPVLTKESKFIHGIHI